MIFIPLLDRIQFIFLCTLVFILPVTNAGVEIISAFAIVLFLFKRIALGRSYWQSGFPPVPVMLAMLFLFGWSMASIAWSQDYFLSLKGFVGKSLQAAFLLLIAHEAVVSFKQVRALIVILLLSAGIICLDSLWQWHNGYDLFVCAPFILERVTASFKHANDFGTYLLVILFPALALVFIQGQHFLKIRSVRNMLLTSGGVIFTVMVAAALGMTYSRGAWIAGIVSFLVFMWFSRQIRLFLAASGVIFGAIFLPLLIQGRQVSFFSDTVQAPYVLGGSGRLGFWHDAVRIIYDHPVFGTGLNTYTLVIKDYAASWKAYPHNCYLQMGAELGLVGLAFFLWFLAAVFIEVSRQIMRMEQGSRRHLSTAFFAGWCGVLVHSGLDTTLYSSQLSALFWVLTGVLLKSGKFTEDLPDWKK